GRERRLERPRVDAESLTHPPDVRPGVVEEFLVGDTAVAQLLVHVDGLHPWDAADLVLQLVASALHDPLHRQGRRDHERLARPPGRRERALLLPALLAAQAR